MDAPYRTILVHVDLSVHAPARMRYAAALARAHGTHLIGAAFSGVARSMFAQDDGADVRHLPDDARRALVHFETIANELQVRHEPRFVQDQADAGLAGLARFADLVVLSQDDPLEAMPEMAVHLPEYMVMNCARPVLVVPRTNPAPCRHPKALVAWNGSKVASFALSASIPLLRQATDVTVAALTGKDGGDLAFREQLQELAHFLGRYHIDPHILVRTPRQDTAHALLALAAELDAGMLVLGCFGHTRFRELCRGGTSRTVLAESPIPFVMAH